MSEQTDRDLISQAETVATVLATQGINAVKQIAILEAQAAGEKKIFIRLLSRNGSEFSSSNMSYWKNIAIEKEAVSRLLQGKFFVPFQCIHIAILSIFPKREEPDYPSNYYSCRKCSVNAT